MAQKSLLGIAFIYLSILIIAHLHKVDAGYTPADPKDHKIVKMGRFAVKEHNKKVVDTNKLKFVNITKAETQAVAAGITYLMTISARDSKNFTNIINYRAIVWSKPWERFVQLISFEVPAEDVLRGWTYIDVDNPRLVEVAKFAVAEHNKKRSGSGLGLEYEAVVDGEVKLVPGGHSGHRVTHFDVRIILIAKDSAIGKTKVYTMEVIDGGEEGFFQLISYEEIKG